jgi:hypothetical protein
MALCRICGSDIEPPERAEVRDYCMAVACIEEAAPRVRVMAVPTHKSTPMFMRAYAPGEHLDARRNR